MPKPFTVDDLFLHRRITELHTARGHDQIAFTLQTVDREGDGYFSHLWAVGTDGQPARQLTQGPGKDSTPRWSPDGGRLAFTSDRCESMQPWLLDVRVGGEARQLATLDGAPSDLRWTPDGKSLLLTRPVAVDPDWRGRGGSRPKPRGPKAPQLAWRLPYKADGMGYLLAREIHLFRLDVESGEERRLTQGNFDVFAFDISADGQRIAYCRTRSGRFGHRTDLWVCDASGANHRQLTEEIATVMQPLWSPDGRHILFSGNPNAGEALTFMYLADARSGEVRQLGEEVLLSAPTDAHWAGDSGSIYFSQALRGRHRVACIDVSSGAVRALREGDRQLGALGFMGQCFAYTVEVPTQPAEVYVCELDGAKERCLTDLNPWWKERTPIRLESREFEVPDGRGGKETIHGWLMRAQDQRGAAPLLNDVHGGPAAYALLDYGTNIYWQVLCSQGWAVLALNAVGSSSYGNEFCRRLNGHWGEYDLPQHLAAIEQLKREGSCDGRVAIAGKSYGGFFSSWTIGHCQEFKAAVVMAPVGNVETHYGTSDGGYYADPTYMGKPQRFDRERARELSPLQYVEKARTPTLFVQGSEDERCPKCQSEEMFVSMACASDTPAELVLYPGEDHHFLGEGAPSVRTDASQRIIDWISEHAGEHAEPKDSRGEESERAEEKESTAGSEA